MKLKRKGVVYYQQVGLKKPKAEEHDWGGKFVFQVFKDKETRKLIKVNGKNFDKWYHSFYIFKQGDQVESIIRPEGKFTNTIILAVLAVIAFAAGQPEIGVALASAAVSSGISALFFREPRLPGQRTTDGTENRPDITGAENTITDGIVPIVMGRTKLTSFLGQKSYRLTDDGSSLNAFFEYLIPTYDHISISDEKLGNTPLTDYSTNSLTRRFSIGSNTNLSNPSIKQVAKDEQLSYDKNEVVNQASSFIYNQSVDNNTLDYDFILEFRNTVPTDWSNKTFRVEINYYKNNDETTLLTTTQDFTVLSGDLVLVSGQTYNYTNTFQTILGGGEKFTTILDTRVFPVGSTRNTSSEIAQELLCELDRETVTCGVFTETNILNNPINNYTGNVNSVIETSPDNTKDIDCVIAFPQGLYKAENDGTRTGRNVKIDIQIKEEGGEYQPISDFSMYVRDSNGNKNPLSSSSTTVVGSEVTMYSPDDIRQADELFFRNIGVELGNKRYTIRVRSADFDDKTNLDIGYPQVSEFNFWVNENTVEGLYFTELTQVNILAKASKRLSGVIKQYNFIAHSILPVWNGTDWNTEEETRNPASIIRALLLDSRFNNRPEKEENIDNESLVEYYEWCEQEGYFTDMVISEDIKISALLDRLTVNCQATWTFINDKYYFGIDKPKDPVGIFNQHNTYNFSFTKNITKSITALRLGYIDNTTYTEQELSLYYYDGDVHTQPKVNTTDADYEFIFQEIKYLTDKSAVEKIGTYRLKLIQEKRNSYEFTTGLESIVLRRYDKVMLSNTTNMKNSSTGLIKELLTSGGNITGFKLYSRIDIPTNSKITIRSLDTANEKLVVNTYDVANYGKSDIIELSTPILNDGVIQGAGSRKGLSKYTEWYHDGDLFEVGQDDIREVLVQDIRYNQDLTATITAREA